MMRDGTKMMIKITVLSLSTLLLLLGFAFFTADGVI